MRSSLVFVFAAALTVPALFTPSFSQASNYPPDYVVEERCSTQGEVEVCALNRSWGNYPRLIVRYRGPLQATQWGRISAFVKLNGQTGVFRMSNFDYTESVALNDPGVSMCWVRDSNATEPGDPPAGQYDTWCEGPGVPGGGGLQWQATPPPAAESALFLYARSDRGLPNAWDVEVAFVADDGRWDSRNGGNYRFRFER